MADMARRYNGNSQTVRPPLRSGLYSGRYYDGIHSIPDDPDATYLCLCKEFSLLSLRQISWPG